MNRTETPPLDDGALHRLWDYTNLFRPDFRFRRLTNRTPFNEVREAALYISCEIVWFDLRPGHDGEILTNPRRKEGTVPPLGGFQFDPDNPPLPPKPDAPRPVVVSANGRFIPEVGESTTTGLNMALNRMAVKIVSAMEQPWERWDNTDS